MQEVAVKIWDWGGLVRGLPDWFRGSWLRRSRSHEVQRVERRMQARSMTLCSGPQGISNMLDRNGSADIGSVHAISSPYRSNSYHVLSQAATTRLDKVSIQEHYKSCKQLSPHTRSDSQRCRSMFVEYHECELIWLEFDRCINWSGIHHLMGPAIDGPIIWIIHQLKVPLVDGSFNGFINWRTRQLMDPSADGFVSCWTHQLMGPPSDGSIKWLIHQLTGPPFHVYIHSNFRLYFFLRDLGREIMQLDWNEERRMSRFIYVNTCVSVWYIWYIYIYIFIYIYIIYIHGNTCVWTIKALYHIRLHSSIQTHILHIMNIYVYVYKYIDICVFILRITSPFVIVLVFLRQHLFWG